MDLDIQENLVQVQNLTRREQEKTPIEFTCKVCKRKIHQKSYSNVFNFIRRGCKAKKTSIVKYGTPYIGILKAKSTLQKRYNVTNPSYLKSVKEKREQTCLEKYGTSNAAKSNQVKEKIRSTNIRKYGVTCTLHSKEISDKVRKTNLEKYGNEHYLDSADARAKSKQTCLEKYGVEYAAQNKDVIVKTLESKHKNNEEKYRQHSELMLTAKDFKFNEVRPLLYNVSCPVCSSSFLWTNYEFVSTEHCMKILYCRNYAYASIIYGLYYNNELVQIMSFSKPRFNRRYE